MSAIPTALELKASGNEKFRLKDFNGAAADYTTALDRCGDDDSLKIQLWSNRATCRDALGNWKGALEDVKSALGKDPKHIKSHFRLAKLLLNSEEKKKYMEESSRAVCIAVALSRRKIDPALMRLYLDVRSASLQAEKTPIWMPESTDHICLADPGFGTIGKAFASPSSVVVCAFPGQYKEALQLVSAHKHYVIIGIGNVTMEQALNVMNTLYVANALSVYISGISFVGGRALSSQAAIALCHGHDAVIHDCHVSKYAGGGLVVASPSTKATLRNCSFKQLPFMAIEVREGGSLTAETVEIVGCRQGITAYGGARQIDITNCLISKSLFEGIMVAGSFQNAATAIQVENQTKELTPAQATSEAAVQWARARGIQLCASIRKTTIQACGQFGLSIDFGAQVSVFGCTFSQNDPHSVYIKGGSDLSIAASRIEFSEAESKSPYTAQLKRMMPSNGPRHMKKSFLSKSLKQSGITIAVNYSGSISISSCVTVGVDPLLGVVNESEMTKEFSAVGKRMGLFTKPPSISSYAHFQPNDSSLPSIGDLVKQLPPSWKIMNSPQGKKAQSLSSVMAMRRPCRSHQDPSWSPAGSEYYAIGNTKGYNLTSGSKLPPETSSLNILLGASGDIRNLLSTATSVSFDYAIHFILNDGNIAMLARNAVLLQMVYADDCPTDHVLAVWANHELTDAEAKSMKAALSKLANFPWPEWLSASDVLDRNKDSDNSNSTEDSLRSLFQSWLSCDLPCKSILKERRSNLDALFKARTGIIELTKDAVGTALFLKHQKEINAYIEEGSLMPKGRKKTQLTKLNVTLLLPELQYAVYFSSSIFRAVALNEQVNGGSIYAILLQTVEKMLKRLSTALHLKRCNVTLVPSDILNVLTNMRGRECFDFIDCSNVADYVSVPALVQAAVPCLRHADHARLFLESLVMFKNNSAIWKSSRSFVEAMFGAPLQEIEHLLGIELIDGEKSPKIVGAGGIRMEFALRSGNLLETSSIDWPDFCMKLANPASLQLYSCSSAIATIEPGAYSSPTTLVHLLTTNTHPENADILIRTISRCGSEKLRLYEWEVETQTAFQLDRSSKFVRIKYTGKPSSNVFFSTNQVVLLALSKTPLIGPPLATDQILQLFSAFVWDNEMFSADLLLLHSLILDRPAVDLYMTVLFLGQAGFSVAASSEKLAGLPMTTVEIESGSKWRTNEHVLSFSKPMSQEQAGQLDCLHACSFCKMVCPCSRCARCHTRNYCGKDCQIRDWRRGHKNECKPCSSSTTSC